MANYEVVLKFSYEIEADNEKEAYEEACLWMKQETHPIPSDADIYNLDEKSE